VGPPGTGKTQLSVASMRHAVENGLGGDNMHEWFTIPKVQFERWSIWLPRFERAQHDFTSTEPSLLDSLRGISLLVLDDVDDKMRTDNRREVLQDILDEGDGRTALILTMNCMPEQWVEIFGSALTSRFMEPARFLMLKMEGADLRVPRDTAF